MLPLLYSATNITIISLPGHFQKKCLIKFLLQKLFLKITCFIYFWNYMFVGFWMTNKNTPPPPLILNVFPSIPPCSCLLISSLYPLVSNYQKSPVTYLLPPLPLLFQAKCQFDRSCTMFKQSSKTICNNLFSTYRHSVIHV